MPRDRASAGMAGDGSSSTWMLGAAAKRPLPTAITKLQPVSGLKIRSPGSSET